MTEMPGNPRAGLHHPGAEAAASRMVPPSFNLPGAAGSAGAEPHRQL